jgi:hypothetical protein
LPRASKVDTELETLSPHLAIYAAPGLYDLAFRYRDFEAETGFLRETFRRRRARAAMSFFELAAGPGGHALSAASAGLAVTALDLSAPMAAYTLQKAERTGVELRYLVAEMTRSAGYMLTASGFAVGATFGGFDETLPLEDSRARRMLVVLGRS